MSAWIVVPAALSLRDEYNRLAPGRDKGADGTIGDSAHTSSSDHTPDEDSDVLRGKDADSINEIHAVDIDSTGPWPDGRSFAQIFADVIAGEKAKWLSATDKCRLKYAIFDRKLYSTDNDFKPVAYGGTDPHTNHAHFSFRYETSCENDTRPWGVYQEDDVTKQEIIDAVIAALKTDGVVPAPSNAASYDTNPTWAATSALTDSSFMAREIKGQTNLLPAMSAAVAAIGKAVAAGDAEVKVKLDALAAAVDQVDEATVAALTGQSNEALAQSLLTILGPARAAELAALLAGA